MHLKLKPTLLLMVYLPLIGILMVTLLFATFSVKSLVAEQTEQTLEAAVETMKFAYDNSAEGEYYEAANGDIYKGDYCISADASMVDDITAQSGCVATFFWGNTRAMTSIKGDDGQRIIGTTTTDENVLTSVLKNGETYFNSSLAINGQNYYVVYSPVYQEGSSTEIVGMVFMGILSENIDQGITSMMIKIVLIAVAIIVLVLFTTLFFANEIVGAAGTISAGLDEMAKGNFAIEVDPKLLTRKDELGDMGRSGERMIAKLREMLSGVVDKAGSLTVTAETLDKMADETSRTIGSVETAVSDIAAGASSQAADTTRASQNVMDMGDIISGTVEDVSTLTATSDKMAESGRTAADILEELKTVNERAIKAIDLIYEQTNITNESAKKIHEATDIIANIAEETNLLSLNASIEAARAGDAGRGFAVVADQIQKLAEQSNNSAHDIEEITNSLIADSDRSVETMNEVKEIMALQSDKMGVTGEAFAVVSEGIVQTRNGVEQINARSKKLDEARKEIVDIIQNLTAIAEENAASTQETSAATAEVTAAADSVSKSAAELKTITTALEELVDEFNF